MRVVFDTNVLVAAARSRLGASYALVSSIPAPAFQLCLSVSLYTEWQEVLSRVENLPPGGTAEDARRFVRYLASQSHLQEIHFCATRMTTWRWNWLLRPVAAIL
jgi:predicted nucleic acid-binding protein